VKNDAPKEKLANFIGDFGLASGMPAEQFLGLGTNSRGISLSKSNATQNPKRIERRRITADE